MISRSPSSVHDECKFSISTITEMISTSVFTHDTFSLRRPNHLHSSAANEKLSWMNTTLFSFSGPMLDLFPLEIIPVVELAVPCSVGAGIGGRGRRQLVWDKSESTLSVALLWWAAWPTRGAAAHHIPQQSIWERGLCGVWTLACYYQMSVTTVSWAGVNVSHVCIRSWTSAIIQTSMIR